MNNQLIKEKIFEALPFLHEVESNLQEEIITKSIFKAIPKNNTIFSDGDECNFVALILSGSVRVYKLSETGREITLYRLGHGESCILTVSSVLSQINYPAIAVTENDVEGIVIPADIFRNWMHRYEPWRDYIFSLLSKRLSSVISTVEEVAFHRMDLRIAEYLLNTINSDTLPLKKTHQEIALDLGTSREVVSRILKDFERRSLVALSRGSVLIKNRESLKIVSERY